MPKATIQAKNDAGEWLDVSPAFDVDLASVTAPNFAVLQVPPETKHRVKFDMSEMPALEFSGEVESAEPGLIVIRLRKKE